MRNSACALASGNTTKPAASTAMQTLGKTPVIIDLSRFSGCRHRPLPEGD